MEGEKNNETFSQLWKKGWSLLFYAIMVNTKWKMSKCHIRNYFQLFYPQTKLEVAKWILEL